MDIQIYVLLLSYTNLNINLDLYASDIRKRQAHPYLYGVEVSVGEPHNKCFTSS